MAAFVEQNGAQAQVDGVGAECINRGVDLHCKRLLRVLGRTVPIKCRVKST